MKKIPFILICALLAFGSSGCGNDGVENDIAKPNDSTLFIGKWKLVSIEDKGTVSDYTGDNSIVTFYEDGRFAYTPYISKGTEGKVYGIYESSESIRTINYSCTENELFLHNINSGIKSIYTYSFSGNKKTLRIVLTKSIVVGNIDYLVPPPPSPMLGKTQVFIKL